MTIQQLLSVPGQAYSVLANQLVLPNASQTDSGHGSGGVNAPTAYRTQAMPYQPSQNVAYGVLTPIGPVPADDGNDCSDAEPVGAAAETADGTALQASLEPWSETGLYGYSIRESDPALLSGDRELYNYYWSSLLGCSREVCRYNSMTCKKGKQRGRYQPNASGYNGQCQGGNDYLQTGDFFCDQHDRRIAGYPVQSAMIRMADQNAAGTAPVAAQR
ncbi:hypothetical protein Pcac1_g4837 [Phytophthora cactorum]|nr:hypothetical protein Pcac1_g4837 [Phytophthora cactorum]